MLVFSDLWMMLCGTLPSRQELAGTDNNMHGEKERWLTCGECKPSQAMRGDNFTLIANIDSVMPLVIPSTLIQNLVPFHKKPGQDVRLNS